MLLVGLFGVLIAVSAYSLWRTYQRSEASLRYLAQKREQRALGSEVPLDPARAFVVQEIRTLCGLLEGESLALKQGKRRPVQVVLAINPELGNWLKMINSREPSAKLHRPLASALENIEELWAKGSWGARGDESPPAAQLHRGIDSVLQLLEQAEAELSRYSTPYR